MNRTRHVDVVFLMGPPGSGKSYLGNELNRHGLVSYTELEPKLIEIFGEGEAFRSRRPAALRWIQNFYREELSRSLLPVGIETTGISDREFIRELSQEFRLLFVRVTTPREICVERVRTRPSGRNINTDGDSGGSFYDYWCAEIEPTYDFDILVSGMNSAVAIERISDAIEAALGQRPDTV